MSVVFVGKPRPVSVLCEVCDRRFAQKPQVQIHMRRVHTKEKPYQCDKCSMRFSAQSNLAGHLKVILTYDHISVHIVTNNSRLQQHAKHMNRDTLELGHIPALFVIRALPSRMV